jgi:peptidoglycan hydrolase-like protein with peptidoglycan-binding domain
MRRLTVIAVTIVAGVAATTLALELGGRSATASSPTPNTATAAVTRATLASRQQVAGTLERAGSYTLVSQQPAGTLTELPAPGTLIGRGQVLYRLDGQPVRLLFGAQSAWRSLELGVTDGADVRQLKRNLIALGLTAYGALRVDEHFDPATAVAIEQWQRAQGAWQTGVVPLGSIAFLPGAVRVTAQRAVPGTPAQPGTPVLGLSSTELVVSVPLDPSLRQLVHVGDRVQIQLPQGQTTSGRVSQIRADTAAASGQATLVGSTPASPQGSGQGAGNSSAPAGGAPSTTVPVVISLEHPGDARGLDQVPVQVGITDTVRRDVLAVPIAALLATAQGGYAVAVDDRGTRTLVAVVPGVFDGGRVEVSSSRLRAGMRVEVPSS